MRPHVDFKPGTKDGSPRSVLIVEDEAIIRMDLVAELEARGFHALEAADGRAAIDLVRSHPNLCGAVVDIGLAGGMTGYDVVRAVRGARPNCTIIITSGRDLKMPDGFEEPVILEAKPYDAVKIAMILGDGPGRLDSSDGECL